MNRRSFIGAIVAAIFAPLLKLLPAQRVGVPVAGDVGWIEDDTELWSLPGSPVERHLYRPWPSQ